MFAYCSRQHCQCVLYRVRSLNEPDVCNLKQVRRCLMSSWVVPHSHAFKIEEWPNLPETLDAIFVACKVKSTPG